MVRYHAAQQAGDKVRKALKHLEGDGGSERTEGLALRWALRQRGVSDVVVGLTQPRHALAALHAAN